MNYQVQVLGRAITVLNILTPEPRRLNDISKAASLDQATCHRILHDLSLGRLARIHGRGMYGLGPRLGGPDDEQQTGDASDGCGESPDGTEEQE